MKRIPDIINILEIKAGGRRRGDSHSGKFKAFLERVVETLILWSCISFEELWRIMELYNP